MSSSHRSTSSNSRSSRSTASAKEEIRAPLLDLDSPENDDSTSPSTIWPEAVSFPRTMPSQHSDMFADIPLSNPSEASFTNVASSRTPTNIFSEDFIDSSHQSAVNLRGEEFGDMSGTKLFRSDAVSSEASFANIAASRKPVSYFSDDFIDSHSSSAERFRGRESSETVAFRGQDEVSFSNPAFFRTPTPSIRDDMDVILLPSANDARTAGPQPSTSSFDADEIAFEQPSSTPRRLSLESDDMEEVDLLSLETISSRKPGKDVKTPRGSSVLSSLSAGWRERWNRPRSDGARVAMSDIGLGRLEAGGNYEMRSRASVGAVAGGGGGFGVNPSFVLVDIPIEATDTLPSFAIKYHVTTAELKRLNNLFADQDFYSRPSLKVPIHKYGILAERYLPGYASLPSASVLVDFDVAPSTDQVHDLGISPEDEVTHNLSLRPDSQTSQAKLFLQNMDRNLTRLTQEALTRQTRPVSPSGDTAPNTRQMRVEPLDGLGCDGADLGIPVKVAIIMALILTVVLPAVFLIYKLYCIHHPDACPDGMSVPVHNHTEPH